MEKDSIKYNIIISLIITLIITPIVYLYVDNKFPIIFIIELFYLIVLLLEKIVMPIHKTKKSGINKNRYYREELNNCSPMINAILLNKNIFSADVIASMILYLEEKGYDGNKEYKNDSLLPHEQAFIKNKDFYLSYLKNKDYNNKELLAFKKMVINDLKKEGIIKEGGKWFINKIDALTIIFIFIKIIFIPTYLNENLEFNTYAILELVNSSIWILIYFLHHILNLSVIEMLTSKGKEYYGKVLSSKRFLKDFSVISSRGIEEKELWNSYLYNAILFNLKGKLDNDASEYYKKLLMKVDLYTNKNKDTIETIIVFAVLLFPWVYLCIASKMRFILMLHDWINSGIIMTLIGNATNYQLKSYIE